VKWDTKDGYVEENIDQPVLQYGMSHHDKPHEGMGIQGSEVCPSCVMGARTWSTVGLQSSTFLNLQHNQMVVDHDGQGLREGPDRPDRYSTKPGTGRVVTWDIYHRLFLQIDLFDTLYPSCPLGHHHHHVSLRRRHESHRNQ